MKSTSVQSLRHYLAQALNQTRAYSLNLLEEIDQDLICGQAHVEFSPIGWHFGHIAFTEAYWILEQLVGNQTIYPEYQRLFAADGLPKHERQNLPSIKTIVEYLALVRNKVKKYLKVAPVNQQERLWRWLIQHESQHCEIITFIWQLHLQQHSYRDNMINFAQSYVVAADTLEVTDLTTMVKIEAGEFTQGNDAPWAIDNERPAHKKYLATYYLDRCLVTCQQYHQFILAGGYQKRKYWSEPGWQWLQKNPVARPLYWSNSSDWANHPVCGVNYYEASAYAKYANKRLPTEAEWEKAAADASLNCNQHRLIGHTTPVKTYPPNQYGCTDMLGNVWEWTNSWFDGYSGFSSYPYSGYSEVYFDQQHRVLRGGSWATSKFALRSSFRNWYSPEVRQIFAGFRCAKDE